MKIGAYSGLEGQSYVVELRILWISELSGVKIKKTKEAGKIIKMRLKPF